MKRNNEFIYKINNELAENILKLRLDKAIPRRELAKNNRSFRTTTS